MSSLNNRTLKKLSSYNQGQNGSNKVNTIFWIEKLLKTPISDFRKNSVNLILAPYLINIKELPIKNHLIL